MPRFLCPKCKKMLEFQDQQRGSIITCSCGSKMRVPASKSSPVQPAKGGAAPPVSSRTHPQGSGAAGTSANGPKAPPKDVKVPPPKGKAKPTLDQEEEQDRDQEDLFTEEPATAGKKKRTLDPEDEEDQEEEVEAEKTAKPGKKKRKKKAKVSTTTGVVSGVGGLVALGLFLLIISGRWVNWIKEPLQKYLEDQGLPVPLAIGVTAVVILLPFGLYLLFTIKSSILGAMPNTVDFRSIQPSDFKKLDKAQLEELTVAFQDLGFSHLTDYTVEPDIELNNEGFARLLVHPKEHCFAEINQAFDSDGSPLAMHCYLVSVLEDDWSVAITDRTPTKENYLLRLPRAIWRSLPDESPKALFQALLKLRKKMVQDLEVDVLKEDTAKAYFQREKGLTRERKKVVRGRWAPGILLEFWLFDRNPKLDWMGKYRSRKSR